MGVEKLIQHLIVQSAVHATVKTMDKEGQRPGMVTSEGSLVLRLNIVIKILVYGYFIFNIFVAIMAVFVLESKTDLYTYIGLMILLFGLNIFLFLTYKNVRVEADSRKISKYGALGRVTDIWWNEVHEIKIKQSNNNKMLVIKGDGRKIRVNSNFIGYNDLAAYINRNIDSSIIKSN